VDPTEVPLLLARRHWETAPGDRVTLRYEGWDRRHLRDVVHGGGFDVRRIRTHGDALAVSAVRMRSLPDTVGTRMRVLVCGLNPSVYAADAGIGFVRGSNRFWRCALAAGLTDRPKDPLHALVEHGMGMTDLVKRATPRSSELTRDEYKAGHGRVSRLAGWLRPGVVLFVGLEGWRAAVDKAAAAGWQQEGMGGVPAYVMPSTSGLNASSSIEDLIRHMRVALGQDERHDPRTPRH
jgi:TDG/mug DNA glycosylase family protein